MATQIPRIAESTEALLQTGDDTESDSVRVSLQGTRETAERAYSELSTIAEANLRALSASEALADASNRIAEVVQAIGRVAWLLSLTGLNASVMAAHTGDSGLAFSTLTKALTSLANLTADEAKVLKDTATELEQLGRDQAARQSKQTREYRLAIQSAEAHLGEASRGVSESVATVGQTVGEAQRRTRSALGTMARIMGSIQREDILRQKIDHLVLVLDEIRDYVKDTPLESKSADELVFVEKACQLSLDLWKEIGEDIDTLVSDIVSSFEQLRPATATVRDWDGYSSEDARVGVDADEGVSRPLGLDEREGNRQRGRDRRSAGFMHPHGGEVFAGAGRLRPRIGCPVRARSNRNRPDAGTGTRRYDSVADTRRQSGAQCPAGGDPCGEQAGRRTVGCRSGKHERAGARRRFDPSDCRRS